MVGVVDLSGRPLMPTNEYRARKLLKQKKAKIFGYRPFTIQLTERKSTEIQPIELCMDTGYIHIGISAKSERHEYLGMQIDTLTDEKLKRDDKRQYRRQRRNRKRYRAPRFDNRRRKEGWIAPSLEHKKEIHIDAIQRICKVMPITDITLEMGNFDTHVLKAVEEGSHYHRVLITSMVNDMESRRSEKLYFSEMAINASAVRKALKTGRFCMCIISNIGVRAEQTECQI